MSDQCKNCLVRGDYHECIKTKCFHHENWISKQRIKRIKELEETIKAAIRIKDLWTYNEKHVALKYLGEVQAINSMLRSFENVLQVSE